MEGKTIFVDKQSDIVDITRFLIRHSGSGGCLKIMIFCFPVSLITSYLVLIVFINNFYISKSFSINNLPCMNLLNPTKFVFKAWTWKCSTSLVAGSLESAYSLIWGSHKIWGKGGGDTLDLL